MEPAMKILTYLKKLAGANAEASISAKMLKALAENATFDPIQWQVWATTVYLDELHKDSPQKDSYGRPVPICDWRNTKGERPLGYGSVFLALLGKLVAEGKVIETFDDSNRPVYSPVPFKIYLKRAA
jgi:hypothetical protein